MRDFPIYNEDRTSIIEKISLNFSLEIAETSISLIYIQEVILYQYISKCKLALNFEPQLAINGIRANY